MEIPAVPLKIVFVGPAPIMVTALSTEISEPAVLIDTSMASRKITSPGENV